MAVYTYSGDIRYIVVRSPGQQTGIKYWPKEEEKEIESLQ